MATPEKRTHQIHTANTLLSSEEATYKNHNSLSSEEATFKISTCLSSEEADNKTINENPIYKNKYICCNIQENFSNTQTKNRSYANINLSGLKRFGGTHEENVKDWLRQFKVFLDFDMGYNEYNLHLLASTLLIEDAGEYYDDLENEPSTWTSFCDIMKKRYSKPELDTHSLYIEILTRKQRKNE
ncbi:hypothetical protein COBT_004216, partial [Conglomerata obtusa]